MNQASNRVASGLLAPLLVAVAAPALADPLHEGTFAQQGEIPLRADHELRRFGELLEAEISEPHAILHLAELGTLLPEVTDLALMRNILARAALDRRAHPEARAYARWLAARTEWRRGRLPRARQWMEHLGVISDLWFVGPFDNEGGTGLDVAWQPETDELLGNRPDPAAEMAGKEGPVAWRPLPDMFPLGFVDLSTLVEPRQEVVVYLRAVIESDRPTTAALRVGTPGPTKIWLDGEEIFSSRADHPARFDQHAVPMSLLSGPNVVLIKLTQRQGWLGFYLRLTDATGGVLRGVRVVSPDTTVTRRSSPRRPVAPQVDTALGALSEVVRASPSDPSALANKARILALRHPFDRAEREHLELAKESVRLAEEVAASGRPGSGAKSSSEILSRLHHLVAGFEDDQNRRRHSLEWAMALDPDNLAATLDLGLYYLGRGEARRALPFLRHVYGSDPGDVRAALAYADAKAQVGFSEEEERVTRRLAEMLPRSPDVISREGSFALEKGRRDKAADRLRVGIGLYPGDRGLRGGLVSVLLDLGRLEEAVEVMRDGLVFEPSCMHSRLALSDVLSANGYLDDAQRLYEEAARLSPDMTDVHLQRALHHLRHGHRAAAEEHLERAFTRRPQDQRISELRKILAEEKEDFAAPHLVDARRLAAAASRRAEAEAEDVINLAGVTVVKVHPSGLSSRVHQEVYQVRTARGVERMRARSVSYTPGEQILRVEQARVLRADGSVLQARSEHERSLSQPWARLYFDQRARVLEFPDLAPGDVVELVWRLEDVSFANMFGDYFGDLAMFQSAAPLDLRSYVLIIPERREVFFNEIELPDVLHTDETPGDGTRRLTWEAREVEKVVTEIGMPGWTEVGAFLHVSTHRSWQDVAGWWWRLIEEQLRPTPTLIAVAQGLVEDIAEDDVVARVAAIHNYVVSQTRYVGLEFGIHGFKPYRVDQIHERRFGDCKDKAALMHALLSSVGIDSRMVILRMRRLGRIPDYPASLAVFNHAILYVPALDLWLDGTAEFAGTMDLPSQDFDAAVLVVDHEDLSRSTFGYVPVIGAEHNVARTELSVELFADGTAMADGVYVVRGSAAPAHRKAYQAVEQRRHLYEQQLARDFPGGEVTALEMSGIDELEQPFEVRFSAALPSFARLDGSRLGLRPLGEARGYGERFAALATRRHDLVIGHPFTTVHTIRARLPEGWAVSELPDSVSRESEHGRFAAEYRSDAGSVSVDIEVAITTHRVPAEAYPAFREFLGELDRALSREIRLVPAEGAPTSELLESVNGDLAQSGADEA